MVGLGAPESDFLESVVVVVDDVVVGVVVAPGDGGLEEGSEFGFDPSEPDLLFEGRSVSCKAGERKQTI
jgi:hypothetical protein